MVHDPLITISCDLCDEQEHTTGLTCIPGGWDDSNVKEELRAAGWLVSGDDTYCPDCRKSMEQAYA